jgi:hypothetical protein
METPNASTEAISTMQKLRTDGSSGPVTIPRVFLEKDHVFDECKVPDEQQVNMKRLGERAYLVRVADDGTLPAPHSPTASFDKKISASIASPATSRR